MMRNSPILNAASTVLSPIIFVISIALLWRGHNLPGGGFIGGLTASGAILLHAFGNGPDASLRLLSNPIRWMVIGLAMAGLAAIAGWVFEGVFFTGVWLPAFDLPLIGKVHLGTFLPFDVGVYLAVCGFVIHCARALDEDYERKDAEEIRNMEENG
ncbi:MAG: MnhB domain-containing protein [Luteolibacter sp.]|jgi:multicomponent Na+:H+ antiporter subunit B